MTYSFLLIRPHHLHACLLGHLMLTLPASGYRRGGSGTSASSDATREQMQQNRDPQEDKAQNKAEGEANTLQPHLQGENHNGYYHDGGVMPYYYSNVAYLTQQGSAYSRVPSPSAAQIAGSGYPTQP